MQNILVPAIVLAASIFAPAFCRAAELMLTKGGNFTTGSPANDLRHGKDKARHSVTASDFYLSKTEVTQREYAAHPTSNRTFNIGFRVARNAE